MDGSVLGFNPDENTGIIKGSDGNRYRFSASDWKNKTIAQRGDLVDFEIVDERASDIYVTRTSASGTFANIAERATILATATKDQVGQLANQAGQKLNQPDGLPSITPNAAKSIIAANFPALIAGGILVSSFLPYVKIPNLLYQGMQTFMGGAAGLFGLAGSGMPQIAQSYNIFGILSLVGMAREALGFLGDAGGSVKFLLLFMYLLYAIPCAAIWLIYREVTQSATRTLRFNTGLIALCAPLGIPIIILILTFITAGGNAGQIGDLMSSGSGGDYSVLSFLGLGILMLMASGAALIAASKGWNPIQSTLTNMGGLGVENQQSALSVEQPSTSTPIGAPIAAVLGAVCPNCQHNNKIADKFCSECGTGLV